MTATFNWSIIKINPRAQNELKEFWETSGLLLANGAVMPCRLAAIGVALLFGLAPAARGQQPKLRETTVVIIDRYPGAVGDAAGSVTAIGQEQIASTSADNHGDLMRGAGMNVVQMSARDIGIRARGATGVAEHREVTLLDGRSTYLDFYGVILWDFLPVDLDEIKQIEILRGPGSAVWGPNALSGVINLRTKSPAEMKGGLLTIRGGEAGTRAIAFRWAAAFDRFSYKISASDFQQDAWQRDERLPDGSPAPPFKNEGTKQPKADARVDWGDDSSALWSYKLGYGGTTGIFHSRLGPFAIQPGTFVGYSEVDRNTNLFDAKLYWNHLHGDAPNLINGLDFKFGMDTYAGEVTGRHGLGQNQVIAYGADLRSSNFNLSLAPRARGRSEVGLFAEDSATFARDVTVTAGLRVDHFNTIATAVSPRTSIVFKPRSDQTLRLSYNRAYRTPSTVDNFLETTIPNAIALNQTRFVFITRAQGNESLRSELGDAIELGYVLALPNNFFNAAIYRNRTKNNIVFVPTEFYSASDPPSGWTLAPSTVPPFTLPKTFSFLNVGRVVDEGLELSLDTNWTTTVSSHSSFTYERDPKVSNSSSVPLRVNGPPRRQASVLAIVRRPSWFASAGVSYTDQAFWADVLDSRFWGTTRSYTLASSALGFSVRRDTDVVLKVTNLFDKKIKEHVFGDIIRRKATAELRYRFGGEPQKP
jgi:outer membrane receptor for ferrienterochelin and colicins